jgi:ribosomal protein S12 methylthiotransferase RimO
MKISKKLLLNCEKRFKINLYIFTLGGKKLTKYKIGIISLGCDKNRVDTEIMLGDLSSFYDITNNPKEANIIIVNTCGFIESSKQESIDTILEMAEYKNRYKCQLLIATGCLTQRYGAEIMELMPEIDLLLGVNDYSKLHEAIEKFIDNGEKTVLCSDDQSNITEGTRIITTGKKSAYIRISEGCDNFCTYCIIPKIRGKYRSRSIEHILEEAKLLSQGGVKEVILIAQDTTRYGVDLYKTKKLSELIRKISEIDGIDWIRLMYCYPEEIDDNLIEEIAANEKVCKYIDMPIQHISNRILKLMGRRGTKEQIYSTIDSLRAKVDGIVLRTSLIVGFPNETEEDFKELKQFINDVKFEKLGVFKYSAEEGTPAGSMPNQIDESIKEKREKEIMLMQQEISFKINSEKVGKIYDVLIESLSDGYYYARSKEMAPEIDGYILIEKKIDLSIGDMIKVKIVDTNEYDLIGDVYNESSK